MKIYKKKNGNLKVITRNRHGQFGGTEVVFMNYSLKGTIQAIIRFPEDWDYVRDATPEEIEEFGHKLIRD